MNVDQELARSRRYSRLVFTYSLLHIQDDCLRAASDRNMGVGGAGKDRTKWALSATNGLPVRYVPAILHIAARRSGARHVTGIPDADGGARRRSRRADGGELL